MHRPVLCLVAGSERTLQTESICTLLKRLLMHQCCIRPGSTLQDRAEKPSKKNWEKWVQREDRIPVAKGNGFNSGLLWGLLMTLKNSVIQGTMAVRGHECLHSAGVHKRAILKHPKRFIARSTLGMQHLLGNAWLRFITLDFSQSCLLPDPAVSPAASPPQRLGC